MKLLLSVSTVREEIDAHARAAADAASRGHDGLAAVQVLALVAHMERGCLALGDEVGAPGVSGDVGRQRRTGT